MIGEYYAINKWIRYQKSNWWKTQKILDDLDRIQKLLIENGIESRKILSILIAELKEKLIYSISNHSYHKVNKFRPVS